MGIIFSHPGYSHHKWQLEKRRLREREARRADREYRRARRHAINSAIYERRKEWETYQRHRVKAKDRHDEWYF